MLPSVNAHLTAFLEVLNQMVNGIGKRIGVVRWNRKTIHTMPHNFTATGRISRHAGTFTRSRFDQHFRHTFAIGRWQAHHSRAYHPSVIAETPPEIEIVNGWLDGHLPAWVGDLLRYPAEPFELTETADSSLQGALTTYHSRSFGLGLASREYGDQVNVLMAHYVREGAERPGVMYTRYLMDDKWMGDFYHATDRTKTRNLIEEGRFWGVQQGVRAIGL